MTQTPDITRAVEASGITRTEAQRFAELNSRTVAKIFEGKPVSDKTERAMWVGLQKYDDRTRLETQPTGDDHGGEDGVIFLDNAQDALTKCREFTGAFQKFAQMCMDDPTHLGRGDAEKFKFELGNFANAVQAIEKVEISIAKDRQ